MTDTLSDAHTEFEQLVMSFATSAMLNLGVMPDPDTQRTQVNLPLARHSIEMLTMLRDKTRGNLTPAEDALLGRLLGDVQVRYKTLAAR